MRTLLLAGGGLTHALFLANARQLLPDDVRVVLVSPERFVPYAPMLPGLVAGHYRFRDCHIDLGRLCRSTDTELVFGRVQSLRPGERRVGLDTGETMGFDLISLNTGLRANESTPGLTEHGLCTRPISRFLPRWQEALDRLRARARTEPANLGVIGGNVDGVEMALAVRKRLEGDEQLKARVKVHLVHAGGKLLPEFPVPAQLRAAQLLQDWEVRVHPLFQVTRIEADQILTERHQHLPMNEVLWCVSGTPGDWVTTSGLALTDSGLVQVNQHLQSVSHPFVFASGALASVAGGAEAGAAVSLARRQAPVLAANLTRSLNREPLQTFKSGRRVLSLITTQHDYALARYGNWVWGGKWLERWKRRGDRKMMSRFPRA